MITIKRYSCSSVSCILFLFTAVGCGDQPNTGRDTTTNTTTQPIHVASATYSDTAAASTSTDHNGGSGNSYNSSKERRGSTKRTFSSPGKAGAAAKGPKQAKKGQKRQTTDPNKSDQSNEDEIERRQFRLAGLAQAAIQEVKDAVGSVGAARRVASFRRSDCAAQARRSAANAKAESEKSEPNWNSVKTHLQQAVREAQEVIDSLWGRKATWENALTKLRQAEQAVQEYLMAAEA